MGIVHEALDRHLGRHVAIKMIRDASSSPASRERFIREARAAAAIAHPNVCLLHEVGEHEGQPFLVMELLEGEPLSDRLAAGPLPLAQALEIVLPVLSALGALHARGLVHRDLKPSNIFLTLHGVKLLDFGLARQVSRPGAEPMTALTIPGTLYGTPRYMAPEQITGDDVDARADIFATGVLIYEMVTGHSPFGGSSALDVLNAILREDPLPLSAAFAPLEPILRRALQRRATDRYASADALAADLRPLVRTAVTRRVGPIQAAPAARLVVLPFRLLKADEDVEFLENALPEAITTSLASVPSLCVRSNVAALQFGASADLTRVARELDVNHVLTGTLLRSGGQIRVTSQLIEMPGGRVRWSQTTQRPLGDLFELQDSISRHILESLPLDLGTAGREVRDTPATPHAYELYLRANQHALETGGWAAACALYEECLAEDPQFAPAWARLGRVRRIIGKYIEDDYRSSYAAAEAAFQRAFALNPDLSLAHHLYVYMEVESGRAADALIRLAQRIDRHPNQAELYAALCQAARYCGLLDVSVAAHLRAQTLDPQVRTSVANTYLALQNYPALLEASRDMSGSLAAIALFEMGASYDEITRAVNAELGGFAAESQPGHYRRMLLASLGGDRETVLTLCQSFFAKSDRNPDGEAMFTMTRMLARAGWRELALRMFEMTMDAGFFPAAAFERDPWLESIRGADAYCRIVDRARERSLAADAAFQAVGGYRLLGLTPLSAA
jgi:TolB-like protein